MSTIFISHSSRDNEIAKELERRLAEQNHHSVFLDLDPDKGIVAGQSWEQTLYRKLRACRAVICLCTDHYLSSHWCFAEVALARMEGKHLIALKVDPLSADAKLPAILNERQFIDMRQNPEDGYRRLWNGLREKDILGRVGDWSPDKSPYLGLAAFQEDDAPVFFGREEETRAGIELVSRGAPGLIMVLGASGSGKSSLVRAGMVPLLRRDPQQWLIVPIFRPGTDPFGELAVSLEQAFRRYAPDHVAKIGDQQRIQRQLEAAAVQMATERGVETLSGDDPSGRTDDRLTRLLDQLQELKESPPANADLRLRSFLDWGLEDLQRICGEPTDAAPKVGVAKTALTEFVLQLCRFSAEGRNARALIIVDQFEELLGHEDKAHPASPFLKLLRASIEAENSPLLVLGTMRSDFLGMFQRNEVLRDIDFESLSLGPMKTEGMRKVIREPAKLGALELESGLDDRLLQDTETPDALPLLSFTLWKLWRSYRNDGKLEIKEYEHLGGLHGAIATEADVILKDAQRQGLEDALRQAFLKMARLGDDGSYARQPVPWEAAEVRAVGAVLDRFIKSRLLLTRGEGEKRTIEVAHEALFRSWQPLKSWLDDNRSDLLFKQQIRRDAEAWDSGGHDKDQLWRGGRLQQARELVDKDMLSSDEREFVRAAVRRQTRQRWMVGTIAGLVAAAIIGFALHAQRSANSASTAKAETMWIVLKSGMWSFRNKIDAFDDSAEYGESDIECADPRTGLGPLTKNIDDYGAPAKSLYGLLCHFQNIVTLSELQRISGLKIFARGPHRVDVEDGQYPLESDSTVDFGHYNPEFVKWAIDNLVPTENQIAKLGPVEWIYDQTVKDQARIWYQVYRDLHDDPGFLAGVANLYAGRINSYVGVNEEYDPNSPGRYMQDRFNTYAAIMLRHAVLEGVLDDKPYLFREYYRYRMATGFWLRRQLDGTAPIFFAGLQKLMRTFDPAFLTQAPDPMSPIARTRNMLVGAWKSDGEELEFDTDGQYRSSQSSGTWELTDLDALIMDGTPINVSMFWSPLLGGSSNIRVRELTLDGTVYVPQFTH